MGGVETDLLDLWAGGSLREAHGAGYEGDLWGVDTRLREPDGSPGGCGDQGTREEQNGTELALPAGCPQPTKCGHQKRAQNRLCLETGPRGTLQPGEGQVVS